VADYPIKATHTTARIVSALATDTEVGVTELADELDLSKASVHNHLATLERLGVVLSERGRYRLGLRFLDLGMTVRDEMPVYAAAHKELADLADSTGESVSLVVPEFWEAVHAAVRNPERNHRRVRLGSRLPLHATAAGKLLLATRPPDLIQAYVDDHGLDRLTNRTITVASDLRSELRRIRDRGLAFDRGEAFDGMRAVAAPVQPGEGPVAALTVQGPSERLTGKRLEEDLPGLVLTTAKRVELELTE
jgi:DNA-binding IclR family transcriptional regulator